MPNYVAFLLVLVQSKFWSDDGDYNDDWNDGIGENGDDDDDDGNDDNDNGDDAAAADDDVDMYIMMRCLCVCLCHEKWSLS